MPQVSAGLLMYRTVSSTLEFFLVHPGGPFFKKKEEGAWTIPKGLVEPGESLIDAAKREFQEETGLLPGETFLPLGSVTMKSGKVIHAWAFEGVWNNTPIKSNRFTLEWPPKSGTFVSFPEIDKAGWFSMEEAKNKINVAQKEFIRRLQIIFKK